MLYPQNGDRIVTVDCVASIHPMHAVELFRVSESQVTPFVASDNSNDDMTSSSSKSSSSSSRAVDVVDLEELVRRWAAEMFDYTKTKDQARLAKDQLVYTVDWRRVRFVHHDPQFVDQTKPPAPKSQVRTLHYTGTYYTPIGWLGSRVVSVLDSGADWARVQIAVATLSGLRQTVHTHCASVHQAAKSVAALLRVARVTAGLAESSGRLPPGL